MQLPRGFGQSLMIAVYVGTFAAKLKRSPLPYRVDHARPEVIGVATMPYGLVRVHPHTSIVAELLRGDFFDDLGDSFID